MFKPSFLFVVIYILVSGMTAAHAGNVQLTEPVKSEMIAANPVTGKGVDRAFFDGKPVLVVFFASW